MQAELDTAKAHLKSMESVMATEGYEIAFLPDCVVLKRTHIPGFSGGYNAPRSTSGEEPDITDREPLPGPALPGPASLDD
jgi:hypothetical protein